MFLLSDLSGIAPHCRTYRRPVLLEHTYDLMRLKQDFRHGDATHPET